MTLDEIQKRVDDIKARAGDAESAHAAEDDLRTDFIRYLTTLDNASLAEKARLVLSTGDLGFPRWCA